MYRRFIITFIFPLLCCSLKATDASQLLQETIDTYAHAKDISMDIIVHLYDSPMDLTGKIMGEAKVRKSEGNYYSKFLDDEMIVNGKCCLLIDHGDKSITYCNSSSKDLRSRFPMILDSVLTKSDSLVYSGVTNGQRHFTIYNKGSYISQADIYIDDVSHIIKKIIYYYHVLNGDESIGAYKVELDYTSTNFSSLGNSWFDESKYILYKKGIPYLKPGYSSYTLTISDPKK